MRERNSWQPLTSPLKLGLTVNLPPSTQNLSSLVQTARLAILGPFSCQWDTSITVVLIRNVTRVKKTTLNKRIRRIKIGIGSLVVVASQSSPSRQMLPSPHLPSIRACPCFNCETLFIYWDGWLTNLFLRRI